MAYTDGSQAGEYIRQGLYRVADAINKLAAQKRPDIRPLVILVPQGLDAEEFKHFAEMLDEALRRE